MSNAFDNFFNNRSTPAVCKSEVCCCKLLLIRRLLYNLLKFASDKRLEMTFVVYKCFSYFVIFCVIWLNELRLKSTLISCSLNAWKFLLYSVSARLTWSLTSDIFCPSPKRYDKNSLSGRLIFLFRFCDQPLKQFLILVFHALDKHPTPSTNQVAGLQHLWRIGSRVFTRTLLTSNICLIGCRFVLLT